MDRAMEGGIDDVGAVSYTHLDVYKRQVYELNLSPNPNKSPNNISC